MPDNALVVIERQLEQYRPRLEAAIPAGAIDVRRLMQSILVSCERTPRLLECTRDSLILGAMTAANLGLPVDGITGQAYLIPRKDRGTLKAMMQVGYRGYITLGARSSWTLTAEIVREHDHFQVRMGTDPALDHSPGGDSKEARGRPIGAYAVGRSLRFPPLFKWMTLDEVYERRERSASWKSDNRQYSPWVTDASAMVSKTVILELCRRLPLPDAQRAIAVDETVDRGGFAYIEQGGKVVIEQSPFKPHPEEPEQTLIERMEDAE